MTTAGNHAGLVKACVAPHIAVLLEAATFKQTLKAGVSYFALVFTAVFVLEAFRTLWIAPRVRDPAPMLLP